MILGEVVVLAQKTLPRRGFLLKQIERPHAFSKNFTKDF